MRDIPQSVIDALDDGVIRPLFLVSVAFDTPLNFSSSYGAITVGGTEYFGAGNLGSVSSAKGNSQLEPNQIEIKLAGISDASLAAVGGSNYLNRDVVVKVAFLGDDGQILGGDAVFNYFIGKTDEVKYKYGSTSAITIIARDRLADWSRPRVERNMNADQQALYPGDKGFEFVGQIADKRIVWPTGEFFE